MARGVSPFLLPKGAGLSARNSGAAEFNHAAARLSSSICSWIPWPVEVRQRDHQGPRSDNLEQGMGHTQEERPAPYALPGAALVVPEPQLFDLIEVDLNWKAAALGLHGLHGIEGEVGAEQVPGREDEAWDGDHYDAGGQGAVGPKAPQEDFGIPDLDSALPTPRPQDRVVLTQALGKAGEQLIDAAGGAEHAGAALASRAAAWGEVDALIAAQAAQRKVALSP
jgi:hypothetical protein